MRLVQVGQTVVCHFSVFAPDGISHLAGQAGFCLAALWQDGMTSLLPVNIAESGNGYYASFIPTAGSWHLEVFDPNNTRWGADIQAGPYTDVYCHFCVYGPDGYTKLSGQVGACTSYLWEDGVVSVLPVALAEIGVTGEYYAEFTVGASDLYHIEVETPEILWQDDIEPNIGFGGGATLPLTGIVEMAEMSGTPLEGAISSGVTAPTIEGDISGADIEGEITSGEIEGDVGCE